MAYKLATTRQSGVVSAAPRPPVKAPCSWPTSSRYDPPIREGCIATQIDRGRAALSSHDQGRAARHSLYIGYGVQPMPMPAS